MQNQAKNKASATARIKHQVLAGESLASLALREYGDARFARLILTVNRGEVATRCDGFNTFAFIYPGQTLILPTLDEAQIYQRQFFTESSRAKFDLPHYARPAMPSDSIPAVVLTNNSAEKGFEIHIDLQSKARQLKAQAKQEQQMAAEAREEQLRAAKARAEAVRAEQLREAQQAAEQIVKQRQEDQVQRPHLHLVSNSVEEFAPTHFVKAEVSAPVAPAELDMSPPAIPARNLTRQDRAKFIEVADDHELFFSQGTLEITSLSHYCRLMKFEAIEAKSALMIKLQVFDQNRWQTIASYVVSSEATQRLAHYADGSYDSVNLELPKAVVKELSVSDFNRNWKNYTKVYFNHKEKIRLEQVTGPAKMMMQAV